MRNTYVKCANWTWEEKLLYIKACIGEDIPHSKICGNASYKKSDLLETYKNVAAYIYCYSNGMISFDEERDGVNPSKNHGVEVNLSELKPKQEKPKPTKFVKVEDSIFDLKEEFERGELYSSDCEGHYTQLKCEKKFYLAAYQDSVYQQVEIDWRDELDRYLDSISNLDSNFDEKVTLEFSKSKFAYNMSDDEFVAACHLVASLTEKPTN